MSVRQVWRETAALFWEYPALWWPVLAADLLSFLLIRLQKYVTHALVRHLLLGPESVFGGRQSLPQSSVRVVTLKAATLGAPFVWGTYFLAIALYATAFFMTAALVREIKENQRLEFRSALQFAEARRRKILRLSLMMLGLFAAAALVFAITGRIGDRFLVHNSPVMTGYVFAVLVYICVAYWMAPTAMRHISAKEPRPLTAPSRSAGRIFAIPIALTSLLVGGLLPYVERSLVTGHLFKHALMLFCARTRSVVGLGPSLRCSLHRADVDRR